MKKNYFIKYKREGKIIEISCVLLRVEGPYKIIRVKNDIHKVKDSNILNFKEVEE